MDNRIISRNSSVGYSSRIYYYRNSEGVPFNWEMQPGTPKEPRNEDSDLPPISPPPAILSLGLPKPCINIDEPKPSMKLMILKFWKHDKKKNGNRSVQVMSKRDKYYCSSYETFSSDEGECMGSPRMSCSSSSSTFSFSNGYSFRSSSPVRNSSLRRNYNYGCGPWKFSSILVRASRLKRL